MLLEISKNKVCLETRYFEYPTTRSFERLFPQEMLV